MKNSLIYMVLDSCRFDCFQEAHTPNFDLLGQVQKRYSFASWTSPAHQFLLMGQVPHENSNEQLASQVYEKEYKKWAGRLGIDSLEYKHFLPELSLPRVLKAHGYETHARVSLPVLNPKSGMERFFDSYRLMDGLNEFSVMVEEILASQSSNEQFWFLNLGETHYPYCLQGEEIPHLSGIHGVLKSLTKGVGIQGYQVEDELLKRCKEAQIKAVERLDREFSRLMDGVAESCYFIVTADHGELFGEDGFFGHGPMIHEKVFEVPFLEGKRR